MTFEEWFGNQFGYKFDSMGYEFKKEMQKCWQAAQKELADDVKDMRGRAWWFQQGKSQARKEMASEMDRFLNGFQEAIEMPLNCQGKHESRHEQGICKECAKNRQIFRARADLREWLEKEAKK